MSFIKEENIGTLSFTSSTILVVLLTTILSVFFVHQKHRHFQKDLQRMEENYTTLEKKRLKSEVIMQVSRINARRINSEQILRKTLKDRVYEAHAVAHNLSQKNRGKSQEEVESLIKEALRPIRFNNGKSSFFIMSSQGVSVLYPPDPEQEGLNVNQSSQQDRKELFQKMTALVQSNGEGFTKNKWPNPGDTENKPLTRITFFKHYEQFDWVISSGDYLDNIEKQSQHSIVHHLNSILPDRDSPEPVFIYQLHDMLGGDEFATVLVAPNRPDLIGHKISANYEDAKGEKFREEMLQDIRDKGEAFVTYVEKKPDSGELVSKLSYFKYEPVWGWIVAKGTYLDHQDIRIVQMEENLRQEIKSSTRYVVHLVIITCVLVLSIGYLFSKGLHSVFDDHKKAQKEQHDELARASTLLMIQEPTDSLTKLYNRGYFNKHLEHETTRTERYGSPLSLIMFDIDKLKQINNTFGHHCGDNILIELSQLCQTNLRSSDILTRWGGEEFVILSPENNKKTATVFAQKLRKIIAEHSFSIESQVTCSFGVTQYIGGENKDDFINRADKALSDAMQEGRNKVVTL